MYWWSCQPPTYGFIQFSTKVLLRTRLLIECSFLNKHPTIVWTREVFGNSGPPARLVQAKGVEPLILAAEASKTPMYASSNTPGYAGRARCATNFYTESGHSSVYGIILLSWSAISSQEHADQVRFYLLRSQRLPKDFDSYLGCVVMVVFHGYGLYLRETT